MGGRAVAVTVSPSDPNVVVAASFSGGLFRSLDGGQTWNHVDSLLPNRLSDVQFNPGNSNELIVSVLNDSHTNSYVGVWMSPDAGNTWTQAQLPPCNNLPFGWQISAGPGSNIFVGTTCGLAHYDGATWTWAIASTSVTTVVSKAGPNFPTDPTSVTVDACDVSGTPRHSENNGASFSSLSAPGGGCISIAQSPNEPNILLAATGAGELWELDGLGASWTRIAKIGRGARYPWVRTGPKYPGLGFQLYFHNGTDLFLSECAGFPASPRCAPSTTFATFPYGAPRFWRHCSPTVKL